MLATTLLVGAGTVATLVANPFAGSKRAKLARDLNNARQVKFAIDGFAVDFDGQYPNADTGEKVVEGGTGNKTSNDFFRQLFLAGDTESERIFWVNGATVCNPAKPDEIIAKDGRVEKARILQAGDCGWAYVKDLVNTANPARPIVLSAYSAGKTSFDKKLYGGKTVVVRIDGSAKAIEITKEGKALNDEVDIFSAKARHWNGVKDPAKLLVQPLPRPQKTAKAKAK